MRAAPDAGARHGTGGARERSRAVQHEWCIADRDVERLCVVDAYDPMIEAQLASEMRERLRRPTGEHRAKSGRSCAASDQLTGVSGRAIQQEGRYCPRM